MSTNRKKSVLNTTINPSVLDAYRDKCYDIGVAMNLPIEVFMKKFSKGQFELTIGNGDANMIAEEEDVLL